MVRYYRLVKDYFKDGQNVFKEGLVYPSNYPYKDGFATVEFYVINCDYWGKNGFWEEVEREAILN